MNRVPVVLYRQERRSRLNWMWLSFILIGLMLLSLWSYRIQLDELTADNEILRSKLASLEQVVSQ